MNMTKQIAADLADVLTYKANLERNLETANNRIDELKDELWREMLPPDPQEITVGDYTFTRTRSTILTES